MGAPAAFRPLLLCAKNGTQDHLLGLTGAPGRALSAVAARLLEPRARARVASALSSSPSRAVVTAPARLWLRHQDLRKRAAGDALLVDDVQLQVLSQVRKWAAAGADRNRDRRQLVFVDEAQAGQRLGEVGAAVDQDRSFVVPSLEVGNLRAQGPAEDLDGSPFGLLEGMGEDGLRLLVHRGCDRPLGRGPVRAHDLVAAAAHRVNAGLLEGAAVPLARVVAEPLEHPFMGSVGAGGKTVEGHD